MPQDIDHVGAAVQAQATHEAEREHLLRHLEEVKEEVKSLERLYARGVDAQVTAEEAAVQAQAANEAEKSALRSELSLYWQRDQETREDLRSLEQLYARAIDAQVTAEKARDDARAECQRLLEDFELQPGAKCIRCHGSGEVIFHTDGIHYSTEKCVGQK